MEPRLDKHMGMWGSPVALFLDVPTKCLPSASPSLRSPLCPPPPCSFPGRLLLEDPGPSGCQVSPVHGDLWQEIRSREGGECGQGNSSEELPQAGCTSRLKVNIPPKVAPFL